MYVKIQIDILLGFESCGGMGDIVHFWVKVPSVYTEGQPQSTEGLMCAEMRVFKVSMHSYTLTLYVKRISGYQISYAEAFKRIILYINNGGINV